MAKRKISEAELAAALMKHMEDDGWDCYPEVVIPGGRADIVAIKNFPFSDRKIVHIIETKSTWSISLLEQGYYRTGLAHYVTLAAPTKQSRFFERLCKDYGLGMMNVDRSYDPKIDFYNIIQPKFYRHKGPSKRGFGPARTLSLLHEDQKRYAPGGKASDGFSTPFSRTMDRSVQYVEDNPGCTANEIVKDVEHHYSRGAGFKQSILTWLETRDGVRIDTTKRPYRFYPEDK